MQLHHLQRPALIKHIVTAAILLLLTLLNTISSTVRPVLFIPSSEGTVTGSATHRSDGQLINSAPVSPDNVEPSCRVTGLLLLLSDDPVESEESPDVTPEETLALVLWLAE